MRSAPRDCPSCTVISRTIPGLALEAVNRGYYVRIPADCVAGTSARSHEFMMGALLPAIARITDAAAVLASLAELAELAEGEHNI